jgi:hypothetical protein
MGILTWLSDGERVKLKQRGTESQVLRGGMSHLHWIPVLAGNAKFESMPDCFSAQEATTRQPSAKGLLLPGMAGCTVFPTIVAKVSFCC